MPVRNIVIGQKVSSTKVQRARELRQQMTPEERILWRYLRANRLGGLHFRQQQIVSGFVVDFYCHAASLIIELDGEVHLQQAEEDRERDRILTGQGFRVLRFRNEEVHQNIASVLDCIQNEI